MSERSTFAADVKRVSSVAQSRFRRNVRDKYAASSTTRHARTSSCILLRRIVSCCLALLLPEAIVRERITVIAKHFGKGEFLECECGECHAELRQHPHQHEASECVRCLTR